jgi:hypothetical protein
MMRIFQINGVSRGFRVHRGRVSYRNFADGVAQFLDDWFGALEFLKPVLDGTPEAFFTNGDDGSLLRHWAREQGTRGKVGA